MESAENQILYTYLAHLMRKFKIFIFILTLSPMFLLAADNKLVAIETQIKENGPAFVLNKIWNTVEFGEVLAGIASGDAGWLQVGLELRGVSDAGSTSMLREAFAMALITSPNGVFSAHHEGNLNYTIEELCGSAFIDEPLIGYKEYFNLAEKSVSGLSVPLLAETKVKCLKAFKYGREIYLSAPN